MTIAFSLLIATIVAAPFLVFLGSGLAASLAGILSSLALVAVVAGAATADLQHGWKLMKTLALPIVLPLVWIVFQLLPLPFEQISHPVWQSAAAALGRPVNGHITVDIGLTTKSLFDLLATLALIVAVVIAAKDRHRADTILLTLCGALTVVVIWPLVHGVSSDDDAMSTIAGLGALANIAVGIRVVEHFERRSESEASLGQIFAPLALCLVGFVVCCATLAAVSTSHVIFAVAIAAVLFVVIAALRLRGLDRLAPMTLAAVGIVAVVAVLGLEFEGNSPVRLLLNLASATPAEAAFIQRVMEAAGWQGIGAGALPSLSSAYQDIDEARQTGAPSLVLTMAIEWGWFGLIIAAALAVQLAAFQLYGAFARGRDFFFAAAGATSVVFLLMQAFCNTGFMHPAATMIAAIMIGLGIAQSVGRHTEKA